MFDALGAADVAQDVVVVGYRGEQIDDHFGDSYAETPIFDACRTIEPSDRSEYEPSDAVAWLVDQGEAVGTLACQEQRVNVNTPENIDAAESMLTGRP